VPNAANADRATVAYTAGSATNATDTVNATTATNATNATNASALGGQPASNFPDDRKPHLHERDREGDRHPER
jgi:hypothetical protein